MTLTRASWPDLDAAPHASCHAAEFRHLLHEEHPAVARFCRRLGEAFPDWKRKGCCPALAHADVERVEAMSLLGPVPVAQGPPAWEQKTLGHSAPEHPVSELPVSEHWGLVQRPSAQKTLGSLSQHPRTPALPKLRV